MTSKDIKKTKAQLIEELNDLRNRLGGDNKAMDKYPPYDANLEISQFCFSRSSKVIGVVDDSSIVRKSIKIDLEAAGYGTALAGSGKKALEMLGHKPDLILLDLHMPGMDGMEVLNRVRKDPDTRTLPVIMLTAMADLRQRIEAFASGADDYLIKPYDKTELLVRIDRILEAREKQAQFNKELKKREDELKIKTHQLGERVKELNCLYGISKLAENEDMTLDELFQSVADIIVTSWQYPEITCARITFENNTFATDNFKETKWKQTADICVNAQPQGSVEVHYLEKVPESDEGPFLGEERKLINAIAERLGRITERKRAQEDLRLFREVIDQSSDAVFIIDPETSRFTQVNEKVCLSLGYERKDLLDMGVMDIETVVPDAFSWEAHVEKIRAQGSMLLDGEHKRKDGSTFPVEVNVKFVRREPVNYMVAIARDVTERKRAEELLRYRTELNQRLIDALPCVAVLVKYHSREIVASNKEAIKIGAIPGEKCYNTWGQRSDPCPWCQAPKVWSEEKDRRFEVETEGNIYDTYWRPVGDDLYLHYAFDITNQRRMEKELQKSDKLESIGVLAGGIAHDFNNILQALWGNIQIIQMQCDPQSKTAQVAGEAEKACKRARDLTIQLLTFARGGAPLKKTALMGELIRECCDFTLRGSNIKSKYSIPDDIWPVDIDQGQISQVLNNLAINADQAMPEGGTINVSAENISLDSQKETHGLPLESGKYVKVSIEDKGVGITEEHLSHIFDPFFTTKQKGSGLGLSICYSIIKSHDGYLTVKSNPGKGTTFEIYLPASRALAEPQGKDKKEFITGEGKVLLMDDEQQLKKQVGTVLAALGYEVEFAGDGVETLEAYMKAMDSGNPFSAVILDLTVPGGMGGEKAMEKLLEVDPGVKAIVSSGYSNDPVMADFTKYGFCAVLAKPYQINELAKVLHDLIQK